MGIINTKHLTPELFALSFDKIASLHSVQVVLVGDLDELVIALAPGAFIRSEGEVRVLIFAVLSDDMTVIELVIDEEALSILAAGVDIDLSKSVVKGRFLNSFLVAGLEPLRKQAKLSTSLEVLDELLDWADTNREQKLLDVGLVAVKLE